MAPVTSPRSPLLRRHPRPSTRGQAGFTLVELMIVVILVSILTVMATPAMLEAQKSRRAYEDAAAIMMLFKNARTRAIGDQAAVAIFVNFTTAGASVGSFSEYESTYGTAGLAGGQTSMNTCTAPSGWGASATASASGYAVLVEGAFIQEPVDVAANISLQVNGVPFTTSSTLAAYCFTPSGRMYVDPAPVAANGPVFSAPSLTPVVFTVARPQGLARNVLVMPSGATRVYSSGS